MRAKFTQPGSYVLRCLAHDGGLSTFEDVPSSSIEEDCGDETSDIGGPRWRRDAGLRTACAANAAGITYGHVPEHLGHRGL